MEKKKEGKSKQNPFSLLIIAKDFANNSSILPGIFLL
jgi:hypothetical protein